MFCKQINKSDDDSDNDHPSKSLRLGKVINKAKIKRAIDVKKTKYSRNLSTLSSSSSSSSSESESELNSGLIRKNSDNYRARLSFSLSKPDTLNNVCKVRSESMRAFRNAAYSDTSSTRSKIASTEISSTKVRPMIGKIPRKKTVMKSTPMEVSDGPGPSESTVEDQTEVKSGNKEKCYYKPIQESYDDTIKTSRRSLGVLSSVDKGEFTDKPRKDISSRSRMSLPSQVNNFQRFALRSNLGEGISNPFNLFKSKYESLQDPYFDTHCHPDFILKQLNYMGSFESFMNSCIDITPSNYKGCLAIFCDPKEFKSNPSSLWNETLKMSNVYGSVGCHPKKSKYFKPHHDAILEDMLDHPKCRAIGEIGLDYSGSFSTEKELQKKILHKHLILAVKKKKPIVIHARDADDDIIQELLKHDLRMHKMHRHCFTGDVQTMKNWLQIFPKSFVGFTPLVTYDNSERCLKIRECVKEVPLNKLLIETDSPYFLPSEVPKTYFGSNTSFPPMAVTVAAEIASIRGITTNEVLFHCRRNVREMYGISY